MTRGSNKCRSCGEFAGRSHRCTTIPGPERVALGLPEHPDTPPTLDVTDRVQRAREALTSTSLPPVPECGCGSNADLWHEESEQNSPVAFTPVCGRNCTLSHCCEYCAENHVEAEDAFYRYHRNNTPPTLITLSSTDANRIQKALLRTEGMASEHTDAVTLAYTIKNQKPIKVTTADIAIMVRELLHTEGMASEKKDHVDLGHELYETFLSPDGPGLPDGMELGSQPKPTMTVNEIGGKEWRNRAGLLHRTDGPAIEDVSGTREWWVNGQRHRTNGPALEQSSGLKEWWVNGRPHRTDGPAVIWPDGGEYWYMNGLPVDAPDGIDRRGR